MIEREQTLAVLYIGKLKELIELTVFFTAPKGEPIILHESLDINGEKMDRLMSSEEADELIAKVEKQLEDNRKELGEL